MTIFDGAFTGLVIGLLLSIPAFVSETVRHGKNLPLIMDVKILRGVRVTEETMLAWSVTLHVAIAALYGALYPIAIDVGLFPSYALRFVALYSLGFFLAFGLVLAPALGLGLFGRREGHLVWLEVMLVHVLYAISYTYAASHFFVR